MLKIKQNERIISEMFNHEILWNKQHTKYRHRYLTFEAWSKVAKKVGMDEIKLKKRWKNLRDHYCNERKKYLNAEETYNSNWHHYREMQFLENMLTFKNTSIKKSKNKMYSEGNKSRENLSKEHTENNGSIKEVRTSERIMTKNTQGSIVKEIPSQLSSEKSMIKPNEVNLGKNATKNVESENIQNLRFSERDEIDRFDSDMLFLKSMHPYFADMSPVQKLNVRTQIQNIFIKELSSQTSTAAPAQDPLYTTSFIFPYRIYAAQPAEPNQSAETLQSTSSQTKLAHRKF